jgi:NAD(P)-dependent dehydrogenase (short-subunit alcohol dehydrogenase family)
MRLIGKTALITGGTSGIGAATAAVFLREGAQVVVADLVAGDEITAGGAKAEYARLDVTSEDDWRAVVASTLSRFGRIDILVNSAGRSSLAEGEPLALEGWDSIMNVNAAGVFLGVKSVVPAMQAAGGGSIVNIASIMAMVGGEGGHPGYHASKGAVRALTKTFAVRYGQFGIRVNAIYPGFLPPMRTGRPLPPDLVKKFVEWTPLGRIGTPGDIATGVAFLASDEAAFITGAELVIDGGFISR